MTKRYSNLSLRKVMTRLEGLANPAKIKIKEVKFGIVAKHSLGIYHSDLKIVAKEIGKNDDLALALFDTGIYEARILCSKIINPASISKKQMDEWVITFENWEICDSFCMGLFARSEFALDKLRDWTSNNHEFVKRAGFTIMASYGFANKDEKNKIFEEFLSIIVREASDDRIYVKKAVNWALRNIGKRNIDLKTAAISTANTILKIESKSARWIAQNALKELESSNVKMLDYPRSRYRAAGLEYYVS